MSCSFAYRHTSRVGPGGQRRDALDHLAARQLERLDLLQVRARRRLVTPQRREPDVVVLERREERPDLVVRAARLRALGLPQPEARLRAWRLTRFRPHFAVSSSRYASVCGK